MHMNKKGLKYEYNYKFKLLIGSAEGVNGTLYLGDGSWGATVVSCEGDTYPDYI